MNIKAYIIHLERASARRKQVDRIVEACSVPTEIVHAIDGGALSAEEISQSYVKNKHEPQYPFKLQPGEVGCFLSHRKCWRRQIEENLDAALILEDDIELNQPVFDLALAMARKHIDRVGYIQFQVRPTPANASVFASDAKVQLVRPKPTPLRTSAQLVSQSAARMLLDLTEVFDRPVDTYLQMHWLTGIHLACATPSGVSDRTSESGGSTISVKKPFTEKVFRTWKRWQYRSKIKHQPQRASCRP